MKNKLTEFTGMPLDRPPSLVVHAGDSDGCGRWHTHIGLILARGGRMHSLSLLGLRHPVTIFYGRRLKSIHPQDVFSRERSELSQTTVENDGYTPRSISIPQLYLLVVRNNKVEIMKKGEQIMNTEKKARPEIVSRKEWLRARKKLLGKEKELTRARDRLNAERRRLPMVKVEKSYEFNGPNGEAGLLDLFEGRRQLMVHHFMWFEDSDTFCHGCSLEADQNYNTPFFAQMSKNEVTIAAVSRAPLERIEEEKLKRGWDFPFYSSSGTDFNYDFQATLDQKRNTTYNYLEDERLESFAGYEGDLPARSIFLRDENTVYHTYSAYTRGLGLLATHYNYLDLTPYGRQEDWEDSPEGWPQRPTYT